MNNRIIRFWAPVILWMVCVFLMSSGMFSSENTSRIIEPILKFLFPAISTHLLHLVHAIIRKMAHLTEYFILALLLFRAFKSGSTEKHGLRWAALSLLVVALYATTDEFHQTFVPSRGPSIVDVGIDTTGGFLALTVALFWYDRRTRTNATMMKG